MSTTSSISADQLTIGSLRRPASAWSVVCQITGYIPQQALVWCTLRPGQTATARPGHYCLTDVPRIPGSSATVVQPPLTSGKQPGTTPPTPTPPVRWRGIQPQPTDTGFATLTTGTSPTPGLCDWASRTVTELTGQANPALLIDAGDRCWWHHQGGYIDPNHLMRTKADATDHVPCTRQSATRQTTLDGCSVASSRAELTATWLGPPAVSWARYHADHHPLNTWLRFVQGARRDWLPGAWRDLQSATTAGPTLRMCAALTDRPFRDAVLLHLVTNGQAGHQTACDNTDDEAKQVLSNLMAASPTLHPGPNFAPSVARAIGPLTAVSAPAVADEARALAAWCAWWAGDHPAAHAFLADQTVTGHTLSDLLRTALANGVVAGWLRS